MEWPENRNDDNAGNPGNQAERNTNFYIIVECKVTRSEDECVWRSSHWCSECHGSCDTKCHQYRFRITSDCLSDGDTDRSKKCCGCGVGHELCQNVGDQEQYSGQEVRAWVAPIIPTTVSAISLPAPVFSIAVATESIPANRKIVTQSIPA